MSTETVSLDAEAFVDEGNKDAGMEVNVKVDEAPPAEDGAEASEAQQEESTQQPETSQEQPATESSSTKEEASKDRSFLVPPTEQEQEQEGETTVPVHVVAKLRAKNRELKEQLEQTQTRPAGEKADVGADPLEGLEDDDFLTAGQARAERTRNHAIAEELRNETQQQTADAVEQEKFKGFLIQSEDQAKADHPDYNAVMTAAEDYMSPDDFHAALRTKNPAKVLYAKAKQTIATLGIEVQTPVSTKQKTKQKPSQENEVEQTDDEVFAEVFDALAT